MDLVSAKDVAHRLIGNGVAEIGQGSDHPVVSPARVLSGEANNERFEFGRDAGSAWRRAVFGGVKFAGDEPPVPGEDGIGFGDTGDLLKCCPAEPPADFSEGGSLGIRKAHTGEKVRAKDPILSCTTIIVNNTASAVTVDTTVENLIELTLVTGAAGSSAIMNCAVIQIVKM